MIQVYQPLHHKYRPERFDDLVGQEPISSALKQALITNRIAPAYLFSGPRGTGKTSSARILARSLNCLKSEVPTPVPCGECDLCKNISLGNSLDVIEIDAASNTGVDNIRELIERSRFAPVQARWKVYVIDECHMLSTAAFNALLKTLEEPPPQVVFVLATTDPQRVLPTIRSRCQRFDFRRIPLTKLKAHLEMISLKEEIPIEKNAIHLIAQRAQGGLRDAESMLDQLSLLPSPIKIDSVWDLIGAVPEEELLALVSALKEADVINLIENCRNLVDRGREPLAVLEGLASILRDLALLNAAPDRPELTNVSEDLHNQLMDLSKSLAIEELLKWQSKLKGTENQLRHSVQPRLWLEVLLLGLLSNSEYQEDKKSHLINDQKYRSKKLDSNQGSSAIEIPPTNDQVSSQKGEQDKSKKLTTPDNNQADDNSQDLIELWQKILAMLELPSTRMLLSQQAKLVRITNNQAFVEVSANWMTMVQSRIPLLEEAIHKALGSPRKLIFENQAFNKQEDIQKPIQNSDKKQSLNNDEKVKSKMVENQSQAKQNQIIESNLNESSNKVELLQPNKDAETEAQKLADFFNGKVLDIDNEKV